MSRTLVSLRAKIKNEVNDRVFRSHCQLALYYMHRFEFGVKVWLTYSVPCLSLTTAVRAMSAAHFA